MSIHHVPARKRGISRLPWLESYHSFSFGQHYDPDRERFGALIVLNEDRVVAGKGFGTHAHDNAEIVSIVLAGTLEHKDSVGNHGVLKAGDVQHMSAGSGVFHSEINPSRTEAAHFLQLWIEPNVMDISPHYHQKHFSSTQLRGRFVPLVSNSTEDGALPLQQDASILLGYFDKGDELTHRARNEERKIYFYIIDGEIQFGKIHAHAGDAFEILHETSFSAKALAPSRALIIELP